MNYNLHSPTTKDFTDAFKTDNPPSNVEDNKENINASRKSSLPANLPPVPSKKTRPRLHSNAKETKTSSENIRENSSDSQGQRFSQKSLTRSNTEVYNSMFIILFNFLYFYTHINNFITVTYNQNSFQFRLFSIHQLYHLLN